MTSRVFLVGAVLFFTSGRMPAVGYVCGNVIADAPCPGCQSKDNDGCVCANPSGGCKCVNGAGAPATNTEYTHCDTGSFNYIPDEEGWQITVGGSQLCGWTYTCRNNGDCTGSSPCTSANCKWELSSTHTAQHTYTETETQCQPI